MDLTPARLPRVTRPTALRLLLAAGLTVATLLLYLGLGRYEVTGDERLANAALAVGFEGWAVRGDVAAAAAPSAATVRNPDRAGSAGLQQTLAGSGRDLYLSVSGEVRAEDVRRGTRGWQAARLILVARGADGGWRFNLPHEVMRLSGSKDWTTYRRTLRLPAAEAYLFSAQLVQASGLIEVRNLSVREARVRPGFDSAAFVLAACWLAAGLWILAPLAARARGDGWSAAALLVVAAIAIGTLASGEVRSVAREWLAAQLEIPTQIRAGPVAPAGPAAPPAAARPAGTGTLLVTDGPNLFWQAIDKSGHFTAYAALGFVLLGAALRRWPGRVPVGTLAALFAFAAATEVLQLMSQDRGASLFDVGINAAGAATGLLALWLVRRAFRWPGPRAGAGDPPPAPRSAG